MPPIPGKQIETVAHAAKPNANQGLTSEQLVKLLEAMGNNGTSSLHTGPLAKLQSVTTQTEHECDAARFYKCADGSCMPKVGANMPSGGKCCAFSQSSGDATL